jgi:hypothetical protein
MNKIKLIIFFVVILSNFMSGQTNNSSQVNLTKSSCNEINYIKGKNYSSKPNLTLRLSGCDRVFVPIPSEGTFIWGCFVDYLREIGLQVVTVPQIFQKKTTTLGNVTSLYTYYEGDAFFENGDINDIGAVLNHFNGIGTYT